MRHWLGSYLHRTLAILVLATLAAFFMRNDEMVGLAVGATTLAIAYLKGRLVVLDYMELRHAPLIWRGFFEAWLMLITGLLFLMYCIGHNGA